MLQSALDAILAELAALQLSGSGGVVNAPAWAGFTTWEFVCGSNVVRNLHLEALLSAALANGDDTLSIMVDCLSIAAADAALAAALLAYYTSSQVDALLVDYRIGSAQDAETTSAISTALLATARQARRTHRRRQPSRAHCWPTGQARTRTFSRPAKSPQRWWRTARPPTKTRPRASHPSRQVRCHGDNFGPAHNRTLSGRRRGRRNGGRHRRADPGGLLLSLHCGGTQTTL